MRPLYVAMMRLLVVVLVVLGVFAVVPGEWKLATIYWTLIAVYWSLTTRNKLTNQFLDPTGSLTRRRPVWNALSSVLLDNELQPSQREHIGAVLRESGYSDVELDWIMYHEVYPVLIGNLKSVAGTWDEFDIDALENAILKYNQRRLKRPVIAITGRWMVNKEWRAIKKVLAADANSSTAN